jgi:hypothetical protein
MQDTKKILMVWSDSLTPHRRRMVSVFNWAGNGFRIFPKAAITTYGRQRLTERIADCVKGMPADGSSIEEMNLPDSNKTTVRGSRASDYRIVIMRRILSVSTR